MNTYKVAVYWDFENLHASVYNARFGADTYKQYSYQKQERLLNISVMMDYILSIGDVVINRAYNNWQVFSAYRDDLLIYAIELIQLYPKGSHAKNGADIRLALDALEDVNYNHHITHVIILGGDSDYIAVAQKLKKFGKFVIGIGMKNSTNPYWIRSCNEFKFYETLIAKASQGDDRSLPTPIAITNNVNKDFSAAKGTLVKAVQRLLEENDSDEVLKAQVRPMMNRLDPQFDPGNYQFNTFNAFLSACDDVITSQKGEFDIMISLKNKSGRSSIQASINTNKAGAQLTTNGKEAKSTQVSDSPNKEKAIYLFALSTKANLFPNQNIVSFTDIGATIRLFDPSFDFQKYGYTKAKGLKAIAADAESRGIVLLEKDEVKNIQTIHPTEKLNSYIGNISFSEEFERIRTKRMLTKLTFMFSLHHISRVVTESISILASYQSINEILNPEKLLDDICNRLIDEQNRKEKWKIILGNILRSCTCRDKLGSPITEFVPMEIATIDETDVAIQNYLKLVRHEILQHFQEEVDIKVIYNLLSET